MTMAYLLLLPLAACLVGDLSGMVPRMLDIRTEQISSKNITKGSVSGVYVLAQHVRKTATEESTISEQRREEAAPEQREKHQEAGPQSVEPVPRKQSFKSPPTPKGLRINAMKRHKPPSAQPRGASDEKKRTPTF